MPAPNKQDDQLNGGGGPVPPMTIASTITQGDQKFVVYFRDEADQKRLGDMIKEMQGGSTMLSSTIVNGTGEAQKTRCTVYFKDQADQKALNELLKQATANSQLALESVAMLKACDKVMLKAQLALDGSASQAQTANRGAAPLVPVQLWSGTGDARVCRIVHVQSQAQAEAVRDYVLMMVHEARASVAPVINVQPAPVQVEIVQLPERKIESTITRDARGDITKVVQVEKTVV